jgi:hypothetical protein
MVLRLSTIFFFFFFLAFCEVIPWLDEWGCGRASSDSLLTISVEVNSAGNSDVAKLGTRLFWAAEIAWKAGRPIRKNVAGASTICCTEKHSQRLTQWRSTRKSRWHWLGAVLGMRKKSLRGGSESRIAIEGKHSRLRGFAEGILAMQCGAQLLALIELEQNMFRIMVEVLQEGGITAEDVWIFADVVGSRRDSEGMGN